MKVLNLFCGPGGGKSTTAAGVFSALKQLGVNCEYVHEWVKWPVWEKRTGVFDDQMYIFAKQHHMLYTLDGNVDIAICDSPLLLSNIYGKLYKSKSVYSKEHFYPLVRECFESFDNTNIVLNRKKSYNPKGRIQTEGEAAGLDVMIKDYLTEHQYPFTEIDGDDTAIRELTRLMVGKL